MRETPQKPLLISNLETLNRKERFHLLTQIMGDNAFKPAPEFLRDIRDKLAIPNIDYLNCQFAAMDYHLDWIYGALFATAKHIDLRTSSGDVGVVPKVEKLVSGTQQDIDFIMAFPDTADNNIFHLVMLEAKSVGSWNIAQLNSKGDRLKFIFEEGRLDIRANIVPHFLYMAPNPPTANQIAKAKLPTLMSNANHFIEMHLPSPLVKLTRCESDNRESKKGTFWKFETTKNLTNNTNDYIQSDSC